MSISFTLPEGDLLPVLTRYRQGDKLVVQIWDRGEKVMFGEGVLESIDNQIDATTGTLRLKARFDNEQELLIPNQFVNVRLRVETLRDAVLIPTAALQFGSRGTFAYVVGEDSKVQLRLLKAGPSNGETTVVLEGLEVGERVVMEGPTDCVTVPRWKWSAVAAWPKRPPRTRCSVAASRRRGAMNISRLFILRPVATTLSMVAILLAGLIAWLLPVAALPQVDYPTIRVMTLYPGASPR